MADNNGAPSNGPSAPPARPAGRGGYKLPTMGRGGGGGGGGGGAAPAAAAPPPPPADAPPVQQMQNMTVADPSEAPSPVSATQASPPQMAPQPPSSGGPAHPGFAAQGATPTGTPTMQAQMSPQQMQQIQAQMSPQQMQQMQGMSPQQMAQWQQQMQQHMAQMPPGGQMQPGQMHPGGQMLPGQMHPGGQMLPGQMQPAMYQGVKCGVGLSFHPDESGQYKITGIRPNSPAAACPMLHVGDVLLKVNGVSITQKSVQEIIDMVTGPPNTQVQLTLQAQYGFPHVMTAPFQELPFDHKREKKKKGKKGGDGLAPENRLFGGGTLPPGFEHLESLRSAQPYTTPSLSVRTVTLNRQLAPAAAPPADPAAAQAAKPPAAGPPQMTQMMGVREVPEEAEEVTEIPSDVTPEGDAARGQASDVGAC